MLEPLSAGLAVSLLYATGKAADAVNDKDDDEDDRPFPTMKVAAVAVVAVVVVATVGAFLWWPKSTAGEVNITLYGYSVKGEVFDGKIIPAFKAYWKNKTGEKVTFATQYAGSGKITKEVIAGAPVQVMILSTEWDALQLKKAGMVKTDWNTYPHNGTISTTPFIIMVRHGNPKNISDFGDLATKNIKMVHPDPITSGGACWSIFGIYGSELRKTNNTTAAEALVSTIVHNIISYQSSAREALSQFSLGYGDAFITYESDAMLANDQGGDYMIVYPKSTIFSEHKVVMVDKNVDARQKEVVEAFIEFIYTQQVQQFFTDYGFRSVDQDLNVGHSEFGVIQDPFYVSYLGGWEKAHADLIDGLFTEVKP